MLYVYVNGKVLLEINLQPSSHRVLKDLEPEHLFTKFCTAFYSQPIIGLRFLYTLKTYINDFPCAIINAVYKERFENDY